MDASIQFPWRKRQLLLIFTAFSWRSLESCTRGYPIMRTCENTVWKSLQTLVIWAVYQRRSLVLYHYEEYGEMTKCDNEQCRTEQDCLRIKKVPTVEASGFVLSAPKGKRSWSRKRKPLVTSSSLMTSQSLYSVSCYPWDMNEMLPWGVIPIKNLQVVWCL